MPPVRPILEAAAKAEEALEPILERALGDSKVTAIEKFLKDLPFGDRSKGVSDSLSGLSGFGDSNLSKMLPATELTEPGTGRLSGQQFEIEATGFRSFVRQWSPFKRSGTVNQNDLATPYVSSGLPKLGAANQWADVVPRGPLHLEENGSVRRFLFDKVGAPALINRALEQSEWFTEGGIARLKDLYELAQSNSVRIHAFERGPIAGTDSLQSAAADAWNKYGSGFFLNEDKDVLTNLHVVGDLPTAQIYTNSSSSIGGQARNSWTFDVFKRFPEIDVAWLKTSATQREQMPPIKLVPDAPIEDSLVERRVVGFGYPLGDAKLHFSLPD